MTGPNIVVVMTDQHRADFSRRAGFGVDTTPFLDGLAERGTSFARAYTSAPACVPARTSLLTGRFPAAHRVTQNSTAAHAVYDTDLLGVLRSAGYRLFFAGKPHMHPSAADFDGFAGPYFHTGGPQRCAQDAEFDGWLESLDHGVSPGAAPFPLERQLAYRIVSDALEQAGSLGDDRPVFMWVSFPEPHNPYQVPEPYFSLVDPQQVPARRHGPEAARAKGGHWEWLQRLVEEKRPGYDEQWRRYRASYCGALRLLDDQVRRLVERLEVTLGEDTLFVFLSDHGDYVGEYGLQRKGAGMPECLVRIPMFFSGSGAVAQPPREELVSIVDLLPTLCELVQQPIPAGVQGRSLAPLLRGEAAPPGEFDSVYAERGYGGLTAGAGDRPELHFSYAGESFDELNAVTQSGRTTMVRHGSYKLLAHSDGQGELYDLGADPAEVVNRFADPELAGVRERLSWLLVQWMLRVRDDLPVGAYPVRTAPHNWTRVMGESQPSTP